MTTELVSLNCLVLGDDQNKIFTVKIPKTDNVSTLKKMIKEEKKPHLDHVAASDLDLWKVSVPSGTVVSEPPADGVKLGPTEKVSSLARDSEEDVVHILVKAPGYVDLATSISQLQISAQLLSLNCLVLGDGPGQVFTVKILKTENVSTLKDLIKEKKKRHLDHVDASDLILSQVSLLVDDSLKESLKNVDLTPLDSLSELSTLFPTGPVKGQLHVVAKVLGEPDTTHPAERAHHQIIEDAKAAAPPSSISNSPTIFKSEQEKRPIYDGRPASRRGPPITIYHTAFAQLKDSLQDLNNFVDPLPQKRVDDTAKLILASTEIYQTEKERASHVYPYICSLLGIKLRENVAATTGGKKKAESDALIEQDLGDKTFGEKVAIVGHLELKNELGVAGQCAVQNTQGLRKSLANDKYKHIRNTTCCPCIIISIAGPYIMFGGAILADIFVAEAFTDFICLGGTNEQIVTLSRTFAAVARALNTLKEYYRCLKLNSNPLVNRLFPQPTYTANRHPQKSLMILNRFDYEGREPNNYRRSLFKATYNDRLVLIKFCQSYHEEAHRMVAAADCAPELFFCERLEGGVMMVIMELVEGRDAFHHFGSTQTIPSNLLHDVRRAIEILHNEKLVFGDIRRPNILVKKEDNRLRALLTDFEWVGAEGKARYPPLLNDSGEIAWAEGVCPHGVMWMQHDLDMIDLLNGSV